MPWQSEERAAVERQLAGFLKLNQVPRKGDALKAIAAEPCLGKRSWTDIKFCVYNMLQKQRKEIMY